MKTSKPEKEKSGRPESSENTHTSQNSPNSHDSQSSRAPKPVSQWTGAAVWALRICLGSVFIFSGFAKCIDPWGGMFKMEEYLAVWGWDFPRAVTLIASSLLAMAEFGLGVMTLTGSFRRLTPVLLCCFMAVMLPLTLWIYIADPVSDCGCFGDALVISNGATFAKNIVLTAMSVCLLVLNRRVRPLYAPAAQVWTLVWSGVYTGLLICIGYNVQPLLDFRPFGVGTALEAPETDEPLYVYERDDGQRQEFSADSLPDEADGWTYVDRVEPKTKAGNTLSVFDAEGEDATEELYSLAEDRLLILNVPEPMRHGISRSYQANQLYDFMQRNDAAMVALAATEEPRRWSRAVRARYPVYTADDTDLKELARGEASLIYVSDDTIRWKTNITAVAPDLLNDELKLNDDAIAEIGREADSGHTLTWLTVGYLTLMLLTLIFSAIPEQGRFWRRVTR